MIYTKRKFGEDLKQQLLQGVGVAELARWAHDTIYLAPNRQLEPGLISPLMQLIAMEEGPEFELSETELIKLAHDLIDGKV